MKDIFQDYIRPTATDCWSWQSFATLPKRECKASAKLTDSLKSLLVFYV